MNLHDGCENRTAIRVPNNVIGRDFNLLASNESARLDGHLLSSSAN